MCSPKLCPYNAYSVGNCFGIDRVLLFLATWGAGSLAAILGLQVGSNSRPSKAGVASAETSPHMYCG